MRKRLFTITALLCFTAVVLVAITLPWLYAWAVPYVLGTQGISVGRVENKPLSGLRLHDLQLKQEGVRLSVAELRLPAVYPLLYGALRGKDARASISAENWLLVLDSNALADANGKNAAAQTQQQTSQTRNAQTPQTPAAQIRQVRQLLFTPAPWLGSITLRNGEVRYDAYTANISEILWQDGNLSLSAAIAPGLLPAELSADAATNTASATGATDAASAATATATASATAATTPGEIDTPGATDTADTATTAADTAAAATDNAATATSEQTVVVKATPTEPVNLQLRRLSLPSAGLAAQIELPRRGLSGEVRAIVSYLGDTLSTTASVNLEGGTLEAAATWSRARWVPDTASVQTRNFPVPEEFVRIPDYAQPRIDLSADWANDTGSIRLSGSADSLGGGNPPLQWSLAAKADPQGADIEALSLNGPWIKGTLSEPMRWNWRAQTDSKPAETKPAKAQTADSTPADSTPTIDKTAVERTATESAPLRLVLDTDLKDFPIIPLEGRAQGVLSLRTDAQGRLEADLQVSTDTLRWRQIELQSFRLEAALRGSTVELTRLEVLARDESRLNATASADLSRRILHSAQIEGRFTDPFIHSLNPNLPKARSAEFKVQAQGPWQQIDHNGQFVLKEIVLDSVGEHFDATLHWRGHNADIPAISLQTSGKALEAELTAAFNREAQSGTDTFTLLTGRFKAGGYPAVSLEEPATFTYNEVARTFALSPLKLASDGQGYLQARLNLPQNGTPGLLSIHAANVSGRWLEIYRGASLPCPVGINALNADFTWRPAEPVQGTLSLEARAEPENLPPVIFNAELALNADGLRLNRLDATEGSDELLQLSGHLPLALLATQENSLQTQPLEKGALQLKSFAALSNQTLLQWLKDSFGLHLQNLRGSVAVQGTLQKPQGKVALFVDEFGWEQPPQPLPRLPLLHDLQIQLEADDKGLAVTSLGARLDEVTIAASALLPLSTKERAALFTGSGSLPLDKASARLRTGQIPLRAAAPLLPQMLRPAGTAAVELQLEPGFDLGAAITLEGVSTRPIQPIGSIESINAELSLKNRKLSFTRLEAQIGAQPVQITGEVDLANPQKPHYNLRLGGGELPLVRSPGLILRARPELTLTTDSEGITTLAGDLQLGQSFYTIDFSTLTAPGGGGGGEGAGVARPPYFAIKEPPMALWQLNVRLTGERFLRVRTPVFEGIVSANFNLRGILAAPFAFGNARLDQGVVSFPYARLLVRSGTLTLRQDDPYNAQLNMDAQGRAYGYDITMHLTGTPTEPNITFDSSPPLEQSEVLLLLTTGQIPNAPERSTASRLSGLGMYLGNNVLVNLGLSDPLDDRLEVLIGEDVTENNQDTITVRYRLTDDWSVIGSYDRFDAYNLDLQWTIYED